MNKKIIFTSILVLFVLFLSTIFIDNYFYKLKKEKYQDISYSISISITVYSSYIDDKWHIINNKYTTFAVCKDQNVTYLYNYIKQGDIIKKDSNSDNLTIIRGNEINDCFRIIFEPDSYEN